MRTPSPTPATCRPWSRAAASTTPATTPNCDTAAKLTTAGANVGSLPVGTGAGQVNISGAGQDAYTITAYSKSKSGANQKTFTLVKTATSLTKGGTGTW